VKIVVERELRANPDFIWALITDYGNIEAWWPEDSDVKIERVEVEGDGVGMVRHIYNAGFPHPVSEQLVGLEPDALRWRLTIIGDRPAGLKEYLATGQLHPHEDGTCTLSYTGEFTADTGREEEAETFLRGVYELMFSGLQQAADRHARAS
jgi:uncharacterized protein YndB with AHSA1/START domain